MRSRLSSLSAFQQMRAPKNEYDDCSLTMAHRSCFRVDKRFINRQMHNHIQVMRYTCRAFGAAPVVFDLALTTAPLTDFECRLEEDTCGLW
jgi:hypothetical protein